MSFSINIDSQNIKMSESDLDTLNLIPLKENQFHVLKDNQAYHAQLIHADFVNKKMTIEVNGTKYDLKIEDEYDQLVEKMGLSTIATQKLKNITAPMPGLILDVLVEVGQAVEKGSQLLILEAMKMENVLKADGEGVVKSIEVKKGEAVDKGQIIIEME